MNKYGDTLERINKAFGIPDDDDDIDKAISGKSTYHELVDGQDIKKILKQANIRITRDLLERKVGPNNVSLLDAMHEAYTLIEMAVLLGMVIQDETGK